MTGIRENGQLYWTFEEAINLPVVIQMVSKFREDQQEKVARYFYNVQLKHYNAWESEERKEQHSLANIKKIEWNKKEQCFHVFYKKTKHFSSIWYHYTLTGEWY